jgi:hypothetical protein
MSIRVRFLHETISVEPIRRLDGDNWLVRALDAHPRFHAGAEIMVHKSEFIDEVEVKDAMEPK